MFKLTKKNWLVRFLIIGAFGCFISLFIKNIIFDKNMESKNIPVAKPSGIHGKIGTFCCAINCMDGRVQDAVKNYIKEKYGVDYVDMVTEPGPNKILAENSNKPIIENIKKKLEISVNHHGAKVVALVGHFGCAGNPVKKEDQIKHLKLAEKTVKSFGFNVEIILLWVNDGWQKAELIN